VLPGSLTPIEETSIFARATGYVRRRLVDIGDVVHKGQLLAEIESPDLDQQVLQGVAAVAQARQQRDQAIANVSDAQARLDLARLTLGRYERLLEQDSIAREDVDTQRQATQSAEATLRADRAAVAAAEEGVRAAQAEQRRLTALQQYESVRAPFDGVVTARNIDTGALIGNSGSTQAQATTSTSAGLSSGGGGSSGSSTSALSGNSALGSTSGGGTSSASTVGAQMEMFHVAQTDTLRVYVDVPQESAALIKAGTPASVIVRELARPIYGAVTRTSRALDPAARTLLAEVQIPNRSHALVPGMFAQVRFTDPRPQAPLLVPGEAVVTRAEGPQVAVLVPLSAEARQRLRQQRAPEAQCARTVRLQDVSLGRDYGTVVEITRGLREGDFAVLDPGDSVRPGAFLLPQLQPPREDHAAGGNGHAEGGGAGGGQGAGKTEDKKPGAKSDAKSDKKSDQKSGADSPSSDDSEAQRRRVEQTCLEQQPGARAAAAASSSTGSEAASEAGGDIGSESAPPATVGPNTSTERDPAGGLRSPSLQAPTQGSTQPGAKHH
jgi:multidrug efflux pump subunit AcrA (membrane-fusion protein)